MGVHALARRRMLRALGLMVVGFCAASAAPAVAALPDGRAYEVVSPSDKNAGDVAGDGEVTVAARAGGGVAYAARVAIGDTTGSGIIGLTQYVAERGAHGWATRSITPTSDPGTVQALSFVTVVPWFSDDLGRGLVFAYDLPQMTDDAARVPNMYLEDTSTGGLTTLSATQADPVFLLTFLSGAPWAASADLGHVVFTSLFRFLPDAPFGAVYEWDNGRLRVVSVLPDGSYSTAADMQPRTYRTNVSADGTRIVFNASDLGSPQLYVRIDGSRTEWISQPEATVDPGTPADVTLQWVSDDGKHVLFTTSSQLLDADTNNGPDLYRWDETPNPAADSNLTLISRAGNVPGEFLGSAMTVGASQDGTRVYYDDTGNNLWLWDHGTTTLIGSVQVASGPGLALGATDSGPGGSRVSPGGRYLAFLSRWTQGNDGVHAITGEITNGHVEMYVYDADTGALTCISCPQGRDATADVTVVPQATAATATLFMSGARPRYFSSDARRIFFSTPEALVPEDTNGVADVYEYDTSTRRLALISTGRGADGAWFADASDSGDDVFIVTRQQLARSDRDGLVDLYDARVGGGFPDAPAASAPCEGDACQGDPAAAPDESSLGSESLAGSAGTVHGRLTVRGRRLLHSARGKLVVHVPEDGTLSWRGRGLKSGSRTVNADSSDTVRLALTAHARRLLKQRGTYRTTVVLTLVTGDAGPTRVRVSLRFTTTSSQKGR